MQAGAQRSNEVKRTRQLASHNVKPAARLLQLRSIPAVGEERADTGGCVMCGYHALRSESASGTRAWWSSPRSIRGRCDSREPSKRCELHRHPIDHLLRPPIGQNQVSLFVETALLLRCDSAGHGQGKQTRSHERKRVDSNHRESPMLSRRLLRYKPSHVLHTRGYSARSL